MYLSEQVEKKEKRLTAVYRIQGRVVLKVLSHTGKIDDNLDAQTI